MSTAPAAGAAPKLYSVTAIRGFGFLFSAIAGGLLLAQNLRDLGRPAAASQALRGGVLFTLALVVLGAFFPVLGQLSIPLNIVGGLALGGYYQQLVPDHARYPRKGIGKPLLLCLLVTVPLLLLLLLPQLLA